MLYFARVFHTALLQGRVQAGHIGDKSSGGCGAFAGCSCNQQDLADLIRIFYQRNRPEGSTSLPAGSCGCKGGGFLGTRVLIADEFRFGLGVEHKSKVKLVTE